jgi:hypothetical protein
MPVSGPQAARLVVELRRVPVGERIEGVLAVEATGASRPFCSWLELLRLLEAALGPDHSAGFDWMAVNGADTSPTRQPGPTENVLGEEG